jgi:hypothetical protein
VSACAEKKCRLASGAQLFPGVRNSLRVPVAVRSQKRLVKRGQEVFAVSDWQVSGCCAPQRLRIESPPFSRIMQVSSSLCLPVREAVLVR